MICPRCGAVDKSIPVPELSRARTELGSCARCGLLVVASPTARRREPSQLHTVRVGEEREEHLINDIYIKYAGGLASRKRPQASDIDREVLDERGEAQYFVEIKERTNSLNAYRMTMFPYAKIEEGKRLKAETGLDVHIVLKFTDCWARFLIEDGKEYLRGDKPFAPRYRPWQRGKERQIPVEIDVETLEILPIRDECS